MSKKIKIYKIMNSDGRFSKGGCNATRRWHFNAAGKTWTGAGSVRRHLNQYVDLNIRSNTASLERIPEDWKVIEIVMRINDDNTPHIETCATTPAREFYLQSKFISREYRNMGITTIKK